VGAPVDEDNARLHSPLHLFPACNSCNLALKPLKLDVRILADLFKKFRHTMYNAHGLDCLHFPILPSLTLQMALKMTSVEQRLIEDSEIYLMIEWAIRGGLSYVAQRHAQGQLSGDGNEGILR